MGCPHLWKPWYGDHDAPTTKEEELKDLSAASFVNLAHQPLASEVDVVSMVKSRLKMCL